MLKMQSLTVLELLKQVVLSWQVIVITIAIVLYLQIVFYVARKRRGPKKTSKISMKQKKPKAEKPAESAEAGAPGKSANEELGLDEE